MTSSLLKNYKFPLLVAGGAAALGAGYLTYCSLRKKCCKAKESQASHKPKNDISDSKSEKHSHHLSQEQAIKRRGEIVDSVKYTILLKIQKGISYSGLVNIDFKCSNPGENLFFEFEGESIEDLLLNGKPLKSSEKANKWEDYYDGCFFKIPKSSLVSGKNKLTISFKNNYSTEGTGLHSFTDTDGKQYIYSQAEPFHCHKFIPCFDQPDIKATYELTVISPNDWIAIANENCVLKDSFRAAKDYLVGDDSYKGIDIHMFLSDINEDYSVWSFQLTKLFSTYLFSVNAGPYKEVKKENTYRGVPMSFFCRESLLPYLEKQAPSLFECTIESMKFFEKFFGYDFPFSKYDQIFCPEYNFGAMENPGAVTINDQYLFRDEVDIEKISFRFVILAHELAHMWFGNLVTMKWWNDLWLNESFAEFISYYCLSHITLSEKTKDWGVIFNNEKGWGYTTDQQNTTHSISGDVLNTGHAENIFDGITYSKGASVLKQLLCLMGEDKFSLALIKYFKKYEWKNATLRDFIDVLNSEFDGVHGFSLQDWERDWISTTGLNECEAIFDSSKNSAEEYFIIKQRPTLPQFPTLRWHKMKLGLIKDNSDIDVIDILLKNEAETKIRYDGSKLYKAVLLNYQDESFIKIILDEVSITYFSENLFKLEKPLDKTMVLRAFYEMVSDGKLSSQEYVKILNNNIRGETNEGIVDDFFTYAEKCKTWTPIAHQKDLYHQLFVITYSLLQNNSDKENKIRNTTLKQKLISFALEDDDIEKLFQWYYSKEPVLSGFDLTIYDRWNIVRKVYMSTKIEPEEKKALFKYQASLDKSELTIQNEKECSQMLITSEEERKASWKKILSPENKDSVQLIGKTMKGFNRDFCDLSNYHSEFFNVVMDVFKKRNREFSMTFYDNMFPKSDDFVFLTKALEDLLENLNSVEFITLKKAVLESIDTVKRRCRTCECYTSKRK